MAKAPKHILGFSYKYIYKTTPSTTTMPPILRNVSIISSFFCTFYLKIVIVYGISQKLPQTLIRLIKLGKIDKKRCIVRGNQWYVVVFLISVFWHGGTIYYNCFFILQTTKKKKTLKLSHELSNLVVYCISRSFKDFEDAEKNSTFKHISSLNEAKTRSLIDSQVRSLLVR